MAASLNSTRRTILIGRLVVFTLAVSLAGSAAAQYRPGQIMDRWRNRADEARDRARRYDPFPTPRPTPYVTPYVAPAAKTESATLVRKKLDARKDRAGGVAQYYVTFYSRAAASKSAAPGHAFVGFRKVMDERNFQDEAFGFYPVESVSARQATFAIVPARTIAEVRAGSLRKTTHLLQVRVDEAQYLSAVEVMNTWRRMARTVDGDYSLLHSNCVAFTGDVARAIGLTLPKTEAQVPDKFTLDLIRAQRNATNYTDKDEPKTSSNPAAAGKTEPAARPAAVETEPASKPVEQEEVIGEIPGDAAQPGAQAAAAKEIPDLAPQISALNTSIHPDLREALGQANREKKLLLVDFWGGWSPFSIRMDASLAEPSVNSLVRRQFYYYKVPVDPLFTVHADCLRKYGVASVPHLIVFNTDGSVRATQPGVLDAVSLLNFLNGAAAKK